MVGSALFSRLLTRFDATQFVLPVETAASVGLAEPVQGRGYGPERAETLLELAFDRLDLGAWVTTHAAGNDAFRRMIEASVVGNGGPCDGRLRHEHPRPDGRMPDQYRYSLLCEGWLQ